MLSNSVDDGCIVQAQTVPLIKELTINQQELESTYNRLLPLKFGKLITVNKLSWKDFKGKVDHKLPWSAHIFWNIQYKLFTDPKPRLGVNVIVSPKSWVRPQKKCLHLLNHEHGHLLIGYLCALQFVKRVHKSKVQPLTLQYVNSVFYRTLKEYQKLEKQYDQETDHRLNLQKQLQWDVKIRQRLLRFKKMFDQKKGKFIKVPES